MLHVLVLMVEASAVGDMVTDSSSTAVETEHELPATLNIGATGEVVIFRAHLGAESNLEVGILAVLYTQQDLFLYMLDFGTGVGRLEHKYL